MTTALVAVSSREVGIPFAAREDGELETHDDRALFELVPAIFAVRHNCFPLWLQDSVLVVAMAAPSDRETLRRLRQITGFQIQPLVATRAQIRTAIARSYP
jgi:type IV pilus assembly protein PilB